MKKVIDINSDVGERTSALEDGTEERLIQLITSANIACGGHAGDENSITKVMEMCNHYNVKIGAHPSFPDKAGFGRDELKMSYDEISGFVSQQIYDFIKLADNLGCEVIHIKPHGALYNVAAQDENVALAISKGIKRVSSEFVLFGLAGSKMIEVWKNEGFKVAAEAFADRSYEPNGSLRSRKFDNALITDPFAAAEQALRIAAEGKVISITRNEIPLDAQTICIHSDTKNSLAIAEAVRNKLDEAGFLGGFVS